MTFDQWLRLSEPLTTIVLIISTLYLAHVTDRAAELERQRAKSAPETAQNTPGLWKRLRAKPWFTTAWGVPLTIGVLFLDTFDRGPLTRAHVIWISFEVVNAWVLLALWPLQSWRQSEREYERRIAEIRTRPD